MLSPEWEEDVYFLSHHMSVVATPITVPPVEFSATCVSSTDAGSCVFVLLVSDVALWPPHESGLNHFKL